MFYEDVRIERGETVATLASAYGFVDARRVWNDPGNLRLRTRRASADRVQAGDVLNVPIPWTITTQTLTVEAHGVGFEAKRDGEKGKRLSWVQTVFQDNQIARGTTAFCVDGCPADDNLPFYWTEAELTADPDRRVKFIDHPQRAAPAAAAGTTRWRAIVSLAVVTGKRVTVFESTVWGFDITSANVITKIGPRAATDPESQGHLSLLGRGVGTGAGNFTAQGWTFRSPP